MNKLLFILKVMAILSFICWGCSPRSFTGEISHVDGEVVQCAGKSFKLLPNAPKCVVGDTVIFTPVKRKNDKRINAIHIK